MGHEVIRFAAGQKRYHHAHTYRIGARWFAMLTPLMPETDAVVRTCINYACSTLDVFRVFGR